MTVPTTKTEVLERVVDRLIDQIDRFNDSTCFLSAKAVPAVSNQHPVYATIAPTDGQFDVSAMEGGGEHTVFYEGGVAITVFSRIKTGRVGTHTALMNDPERGLFPLEQQILRALAGYMLTNEDGDGILTSHMTPLNDTSPNEADNEKPGDIQVTFATNFDWKMA